MGSNRRHHWHGSPKQVLGAALTALADAGLEIERVAPVVRSAPLGPSARRYANSAVTVRSERDPPALLGLLKRIEQDFGRRSGGRRWSARVLDLDIILWEGGCWSSPFLVIPHVQFPDRRFVLGPARAIAPDWRDPLSGLTVRQLHARLTQPRPLP